MTHAIRTDCALPEAINAPDEKVAIGMRYTRDNFWFNGRFRRLPYDREHEQRIQWWREARYGMMIHWGPAAAIGRHPRVMINEEHPSWDVYDQAIAEWQPRPDCAEEWIQLAASGGMKYAVMVAKHHDGYCLWDTQQTDFNSVKNGPGRDFVREYVDACRKHGVRPGIYFSLWDIHHPDTATARHDEDVRERLVSFAHAQIEELMTNYGDIGTLWYDVPTPLSPDQWKHAEINTEVRRWQPGIIINDRMGTMEDYATMDYGNNPKQGLIVADPGRDWEVALPMNGAWAHVCGAEQDYMPVRR